MEWSPEGWLISLNLNKNEGTPQVNLSQISKIVQESINEAENVKLDIKDQTIIQQITNAQLLLKQAAAQYITTFGMYSGSSSEDSNKMLVDSDYILGQCHRNLVKLVKENTDVKKSLVQSLAMIGKQFISWLAFWVFGI